MNNNGTDALNLYILCADGYYYNHKAILLPLMKDE